MDQNKWQKINSSSKLTRPLQLKKLKQTISGTSPPFAKNLISKEIKDKPAITKQKQSSSTNILFPSKNGKMNSTDKQPKVGKRMDLKRMSTKNDSVFDDYYQKKASPQLQKDKKQQISISGDSFQSEGFASLKKQHNSPKSLADKKGNPIKNMVASPVMNPQENRGGYKSPANRPVNRNQSQEEKTTGKRILSFGGKKIMAGRFLEDGDAYNKKPFEQTALAKPASPLVKSSKYLGLNLSDQKDKKSNTKQNTSNDDNPQSKNNKNPKNIPKFISNPNIKSSPYLLKHNLDSSNEISGDRGLKNIQKLKKQFQNQSNQQKRIKATKQQEQKSLTFNKGQMFLSLKKRQQQHSIRSKQLSMLGSAIDLKTYTAQGQKQVKITLIKKINQSKKTCIYLAYHQTNSFWYCLKKTSLAQDKKKYLQQAIQQYKIQQFCCHPHLVKSFCFAYDQHDTYLIMEYMQSQTLRHELKNELLRNMSEQNAAKAKINESVTSQISKINKIRKILFQILSGVAYLHERSIVQRDIKPDNIFISHDTYKLGDFGSAAKIGSLQYVGTLDYAAPEILTQSPYDQRVDIWSLGCIAYELDVGRPPFFHINPQQTKRLAINGQYDKMLISDGQLKILIEKMLQINRKYRVSSKDLLKTQFFQDLHERNLLF